MWIQKAEAFYKKNLVICNTYVPKMYCSEWSQKKTNAI